MSQQYGLPGLVDGAVEGAACYNWQRFPFGQTSNGSQMICAGQGDGTGKFRLTPKAMRLFQSKVLTQIFSALQASRTGRHPDSVMG